MFFIDSISTFFMCLALGLGTLVLFYSFNTLKEDDVPELYFSLLCLFTVSLLFFFSVGDLISLFASWELMCITLYALIFLRRSEPLSLEAGTKYLMMSALSSALIIYSISLIYGTTGRLDFIGIHDNLNKMSDINVLYLAAILLIVAFGFKAAIVPFHTWAPDVYQETIDPVTALLSGIASKTGIYALLRICLFLIRLPKIGIILALLATITMTLGNIVALLQRDLKRLLAYSSISHMGYILVGIATGTPYGVLGALFHSLNHAIAKPLLFFCTGEIKNRYNSRNLDKISGCGRLLPSIGLPMSLGIFSLMGIPGLNGFISKFILVSAAFKAGFIWLAVVTIINSAIAVAYYLRILQVVFRQPKQLRTEQNQHQYYSSPIASMIAIFVLMILCIIIGIAPSLFYNWLDLASRSLFSKTYIYLKGL